MKEVNSQPEQNLTWLCNMYDPRLPDAVGRNVPGSSKHKDIGDHKEDIRYYHEWLKGKIIGEPKVNVEGSTETVIQLKQLNIVGIYKPSPILSSVKRRANAGIPTCPISRSEFIKYAKPIKVYLELSEGEIPETVFFNPKWDFPSGSYGWQQSVKLPHSIKVGDNDIEVKLQFVCNIIVVGSKDMPKERSE